MSLLYVDAAQAAEIASVRRDWWFVPVGLEADGRGGFRKRPLVPWTAEAARGPLDVGSLWERVVGGGRAGIAVVTGPSGLVVLDEDHSDYPVELRAHLDGLGALTLQSCTKARPHWFFAAETDSAGVSLVREGQWPGGDVKATGLVFLAESSLDVLLGAEVGLVGVSALLAEGSPFRGVLRGGGSVAGVGSCSAEELWRFLDGLESELDVGFQASLVGRVCDRLVERVRSGEHRRSACLEAVHHALIEASAGLYSGRLAFEALEECYAELRAGDGSWNAARSRDWLLMWTHDVPKFRAGLLDGAVEECRTGAEERGVLDSPEMSDGVRWLLEAVEQDWFAGPVEDCGVSPESQLPAGITDSGGSKQTSLQHPNASHSEPESPADRVRQRLAELARSTVVEEPPRASSEAVSAVVEPPVVVEPEPVAAAEAASRAWEPPEGLSVVAEEVRTSREPSLGEEAFCGPVGALVRALSGKHEAADVGVLAALLAECGALLAGQAAWRVAGVDPHGPQIMLNLIGQSGAARKTHAMSIARNIMQGVSYLSPLQEGARHVKCKGSGEFLVHKTWKPVAAVDAVTGKPVLGADGKPELLWPERRVLFSMPEVSSLWKKARSDGSTMGETFCEMWDQGRLEAGSLTSGEAVVPADKYLCGLLGASTLEVARRHVLAGDDAYSGFGNRFLWWWLPESDVDLPSGGDVLAEPAVRAFQELFSGLPPDAGSGFGAAVSWSAAAGAEWNEIYGWLKRESKGSSPLVQGLCGRAEPYVKRLALLYAMVSGLESGGWSWGLPVEVGVESLKAALTCWRYVVETVTCVFGSVVPAGSALEKLLLLIDLGDDLPGGVPGLLPRFEGAKALGRGNFELALREGVTLGLVEVWSVPSRVEGGGGGKGRHTLVRPGSSALAELLIERPTAKRVM